MYCHCAEAGQGPEYIVVVIVVGASTLVTAKLASAGYSTGESRVSTTMELEGLT